MLHDGADDAAVTHRVDGFLDVVERPHVRDLRGELEVTAARMVDDRGEIACRVDRTVGGDGQLPLRGRRAERVEIAEPPGGVDRKRASPVQILHLVRIALQIVGNLGGLEVLVNGASSLGPTPLALLGDTECEDFELALATNVLGPFRLTKALLGSLTASAREGGGSVVLNISSDAAVNAYPQWGAYGASKAALHHMSRIWNEELAAEGVRFLSLDPGDMDTPMHALAVPDADRATLKRPEIAARELGDAIAAALFGSLRTPSMRRAASPNPSAEAARLAIGSQASPVSTAVGETRR